MAIQYTTDIIYIVDDSEDITYIDEDRIIYITI